MTDPEWVTRLQKWKFIGITFFADTAQKKGGNRRKVLQEYAGSDDHSIDDLGRNARQYTVDAYLIGDNYDRQAKALEQVLDVGKGELIHRYRGKLQVEVLDYEGPTISTAEGGIAKFTITFADQGVSPFELATESTDDLVIGAADATLAANQAEFGDSFNVVGELPSVENDGLSRLQQATAGLQKLNKVVDVGTQPLANLSLDIDSLSSELNELIRTPGTLATRVQGIYGSVTSAALSIKSSIEADLRLAQYYAELLGLTNSGDDPVLPVSPTVSQQKIFDNAITINNLFRVAAVASVAKVAQHRTYETQSAAFNVRSDIIDSVDSLIPNVEIPLVNFLIDTKNAVSADIKSRDIAVLIDFDISGQIPGLIAANSAYLDWTRIDDIVRFNEGINPFLITDRDTLRVMER